MHEKVCAGCDSTFSTYDVEAKYCSRRCSDARVRKVGYNPEEVLDLFKTSGLSQRAIAEKVGLSASRVAQLCSGLSREVTRPSKHTYNGAFSSIDTEEKAYWVGFLLGDGGVSGSRLSITLLAEDGPHLQSLASLVGAEVSPKASMAPSLLKYKNTYCTLGISNAELVRDLFLLGIVPNKTLTADLPLDRVPRELWRDLLRGVFDADGCVGVYRKKVQKETWYPWTPRVTLCGSPTLVRSFQRVVEELTGHLVPIQERKDTYHIIETGGWRKGVELADFLYADCVAVLPRKLQKYQELKSRQPAASIPFVGSTFQTGENE